MNAKNDTVVDPTENGNFIEPPPMRWTLRLIFIVVFIVGIIGNSVVCAAVIRRKRMRTSNNIFTFNLALCDLLIVVIYLPTQMAAFENNQSWAVGNFMCHVVYILVPLCLNASIGTLLAITCDRYRAIAYPLKPRLSGKFVKIILAIIWLSSLAISSPVILVAGEVRSATGKVFCDETWPKKIYFEIYWNFIFVIQYFLPLTLIAVLAVLIALKIRQNNAIKLLPQSSQAIAAAVRQRMKQTSKITNMLIALVILYAVCMLPQHLVFLWWTYGDLGSSTYRVYVLRFSNVFPMANSALNPIAYGTLNAEFKKVFKSFFNCEFHKSDDVRNMQGPRVSNPLKRTGKRRLTMYKRASADGTSPSNADKQQKESILFLELSSKEKTPGKKERSEYKKAESQDSFNCEFHKSDDVRNMQGSRVSNPLKRTGKRSLTMYKRASADGTSPSNADKQQKESILFLELSSKEKTPGKKERSECKKAESQDSFLSSNGNVSLSTTSQSNCGEETIRDEDGFRGSGAQNKYFKLRNGRSPVRSGRTEDEQKLLNCDGKIGNTRDKVTQFAFPKVKRIVHSTCSQRDTDICDGNPGMTTRHSKDELNTQQMTFVSQEQPFNTCWTEAESGDNKLLAYITALKETDI